MSDDGDYEWPSDDEKDEEENEGWIAVENTFYEAEDQMK